MYYIISSQTLSAFFVVGARRIRLCLMIYKTLGVSMFLLLLFEPFSIGFETLQVMLLEHYWQVFNFIMSFMQLYNPS